MKLMEMPSIGGTGQRAAGGGTVIMWPEPTPEPMPTIMPVPSPSPTNMPAATRARVSRRGHDRGQTNGRRPCIFERGKRGEGGERGCQEGGRGRAPVPMPSPDPAVTPCRRRRRRRVNGAQIEETRT